MSDKMYRLIVLLAIGVASVLAIDKECIKLSNPHARRCCKLPAPQPVSQPRNESFTECFQKFGKSFKHGAELDCELDLCIGKVMGYVAEDGSIDMKALEAQIVNKFNDRPEQVDKVVKNCINADVKEYGPEGLCELKKKIYCMHVHFTMACPEFHDKEHCSEIKALAEKCATE